MPNIVFIAAGKKLAALGQQFRKTLPFPASFTVVETKMEDAVDYCRSQLPQNTDAIIARGNTANMLRSAHIQVPIITLPIQDSELIHSITTAIRLFPDADSRIAYIGLEDVVRSVQEFLKLIHKEIRFFSIKDSRDIQTCIRMAKQEHIQVVIGGEYTKELADAQGLSCVLLESTESSLKEAYTRALEIQKGVQIQKRKLLEKLVLMNSISDVIVGIQEKGYISLFNHAAETLFSKKESDAIGKAASSLFGTEELAILNRTLLRGDEVLSHPVSFSGSAWFMDVRPVLIHGKSKGAILRIYPATSHNRNISQNTEGAFPSTSHVTACKYHYPRTLIGQSPSFLTACALSTRFARSSLPVLITGACGTGKTAFAYQIHCQSARKDAVFLIREGALLTIEDLISANGGSLCIHDIHALSASMIPTLNQLLEHGFLFLPDHSFLPLDVRLFATSSPEAEQTLDTRLFCNFSALSLELPKLSERPEDIWPLFASMLQKICHAQNCQIPLPESDTSSLFSGTFWPGNIRQLQSIARRFACMAPKVLSLSSHPSSDDCEENYRFLKQCLEPFHRSCKTQDMLSDALSCKEKNAPADLSTRTLSSEHSFVIHGRIVTWDELKALEQYYHGHRSLLAKQLGISRSTLWRYFKEMDSADSSSS